MLYPVLMFAIVQAQNSVKFYDPATGRDVSLQQLVDTAKFFDVIIFGEIHDSKDCHKAELEVLKALHRKYPIIFSLEMFERDVQSYLDQYLQGKINEDSFLKVSRPWPNYKTDYRPLIEYCKTNNIPVIAANVPRYIANKVAKQGPIALDSLSTKEKTWVASKIYYGNEQYRKNFYATMEELKHMPHITPQVLENFFKAQCVKDATMAESIYRARDNKKVFHINGAFHSNYHLGVAWQLKKLDPKLKILVISPVKKGEKPDKNIGDLIFFYEQ